MRISLSLMLSEHGIWNSHVKHINLIKIKGMFLGQDNNLQMENIGDVNCFNKINVERKIY